MKQRLFALVLCLTVLFSLCSCGTESEGPALLNGKKNEYSETIAYAALAQEGVHLSETEGVHSLQTDTAQLEFDEVSAGLKSLTSLQTGETLLKDTVTTYLTTPEGVVAELCGGTESVEGGRYGIGHHRKDCSVMVPSGLTDATALKSYDFSSDGVRNAFSALVNGVSVAEGEQGMKVSSQGGSRAQFGARYLGIRLDTYDHYYLSVTLRAEGITGLKCYFSTDTVPLDEDTALGTLDLAHVGESEFITLTAKIENKHWKGTLQTLLFRFLEGESGSVEVSRIAVLGLNDVMDEGVADTLWTVYGDRIYFSQTLQFNSIPYSACSTVLSVNRAKCKNVSETEHGVALKMIDGTVLGVVRPSRGATLRTEETEAEIRIVFDWDLSLQSPNLAFRIYVNYAETAEEFERLAAEERTPLTSEYFILDGAEFVGYDPKGGIYRLNLTGQEVSVTVAKNHRCIFIYLAPAEGTVWELCDADGNRLPVFVGSTFPLCCNGKELTLRLVPQTAPKSLQTPEFFPDSGLVKLSEQPTVLDGLCSQNTAIYASADGTYSVDLTSTRLDEGTCTIYDIRYTFHTRTHVSDVLNTFPFFSFELTYGFEEYFYRNGEEETVTVPAGNEAVAYLGSMPYVGLTADTESAGWLITGSAMTVGGESSTALLALRYAEVAEGEPNKLYLAFDLGETEFVPGDTLTAQVIRLEETSDLETSLKSLRSQGNFRLIQKETATCAPFTTMGMEDSVIVQVEGFSDYRFPEFTANGAPFRPSYHVYVDANGYYGFAFSVPVGTELFLED